MKQDKFDRQLIEERNRAASEGMEDSRNRYPNIQVGDLYFCVRTRAGNSCAGSLCRNIEEGLLSVGSFSLIHCSGEFYTIEILAALKDDSLRHVFSAANLDSLANRLRLHLGIPESGPARATCWTGGTPHFAMTAKDPKIMAD